jgi:hypothetical protein
LHRDRVASRDKLANPVCDTDANLNAHSDRYSDRCPDRDSDRCPHIYTARDAATHPLQRADGDLQRRDIQLLRAPVWDLLASRWG